MGMTPHLLWQPTPAFDHPSQEGIFGERAGGGGGGYALQDYPPHPGPLPPGERGLVSLVPRLRPGPHRTLVRITPRRPAVLTGIDIAMQAVGHDKVGVRRMRGKPVHG